MLFGGGVFGLAATAAVAVAGVVAGAAAVVAAVVGGVLAVAALSAVPAVMRWSRAWSPVAVMAAALATYLLTFLVLGLAAVALQPVSWLPGPWTGAGFVAATVAWAVGDVIAVRRLRVLAFGDAAETPPG